MKKLEDFADDINKCSKCGLCQSVCPVYKLTGNDCAVSRGKFVMLDGVLKGDLKLNKNIEKYLDMCLKCGKCKQFCPSNIDVCDIFNTAKYECAKNTFHGKFEKFLESRAVLGHVIKFFKLFTKAGLPRNDSFSLAPCGGFADGWNGVKPDSEQIEPTGAQLHGRNSESTEQIQDRRGCRKATGEGLIKLLYFKGCVNDVFPKVEYALKKIFSHLDVEVIERDFECCGLPFLSSGNMERFEEVKKHNLELINSCDFDYILTDCASCEHTLKTYGCKNIINAAEFLAYQDIKFRFKKPVKVTFHKPCHLENDDFFKPLLGKCENVEYVEMKDYDECCGFAGEFAIKNTKISLEISRQKAENAFATGAEYIITTCPACIMGLHQGFMAARKKAPKIMNIVEFFSTADILDK